MKLTAFTAFWPGTVTGLPKITSCSLPNAIIEPAKLTPPTIAENSVEIESWWPGRMARPIRSWYSEIEISAAAPPPTPLNSATICGIAVIFTARAEYAPITPPMTMPAMIQARLRASASPQRHADRQHHAEGGDLVAAHRGAR